MTKTKKCKKCNRPLKTFESIRLGLGPVCANKLNSEKRITVINKNQIDMFDIINVKDLLNDLLRFNIKHPEFITLQNKTKKYLQDN